MIIPYLYTYNLGTVVMCPSACWPADPTCNHPSDEVVEPKCSRWLRGAVAVAFLRAEMLRLLAAAGYLLLASRCCGQNSWTPDRDDAQNLQLLKDLNTYLPPATQQYPAKSLSDEPPFVVSWHMGQNIHDTALGPVQGELFFKNGAACWLAEDEIVVTSGLWYAPRLPQGAPFNSTYLYRPSNDSWTKLAPAPFLASRTSGACDPKTHTLYLVSGLEGKCAGGKGCVAALSRANAGGADGAYSWRFLPGIPDGTRYLGASGFLAAADGSQWLVTATGMASGVPPVGAAASAEPRRQSEPASVWALATTKLEGRRTGAELPGYRMKLGGANASLRWEVTAPFPGGGSNSDHGCLIPQTANLNGSFYLFGGMAQVVPNATAVWDDMVDKYALPITDTSAGCAVFHTSWRYDVLADKWSALPSPPFPVVAGGTVVLRNRFIVLLGSEQRTTFRVGNTSRGTLPAALPFWSGYGDQVLCFDTHTSMWSRIGLMPYGLGTLQTVTNGSHIYTFGGEPTTHHNANTENAVQIGVITMLKTDGVE